MSTVIRRIDACQRVNCLPIQMKDSSTGLPHCHQSTVKSMLRACKMTSFCGVLGAYVTSETVFSQYRYTCSSLLVISLLGPGHEWLQ